MAEETTDTTATTTETTEPEAEAPKELGDAGKKALQAEREARKQAEKRAKEFEDRIKAIEDKDKSEAQRALDKATKHETEAQTLKAENARLRVGLAKGVPIDLIDRLRGRTEDEINEDADKLLALVKPADTQDGRRPQERLRPGATPTVEPEEMDPRKLAEGVSSSW